MGPSIDRMMGEALAEQRTFEDVREIFPSHFINTIVQEPEKAEKDEGSIGMIPVDGERLFQLDRLTSTHRLLHRLAEKSSPRIYVLGVGKVGKFVAHALAGVGDPPPITLLSHRQNLLQQWRVEGEALELINGDTTHIQTGIDIEHTKMSRGQRDKREWMIDKLIVATKASVTAPALLPIKDRLLPSSTICFLQDGMGIIEDVNTRVFPNPATRPRYMVGVTSHSTGNHLGRTFATVHSRSGEIYLSLAPRDIAITHTGYDIDGVHTEQKPLIQRMYYGWIASSWSLMRSLTRTPVLNARGFQHQDLLRVQLERLAVDAVINPLSAVFDCANGKLLSNFAVTRLMRELLEEMVTVTRMLPELRNSERFKNDFTPQRLERLTVEILTMSSNSISQMLQDVRRGKRTDIDFINGYIVKRGLELGIPCPVNAFVVQMVKAKQAMRSKEEETFAPFARR